MKTNEVRESYKYIAVLILVIAIITIFLSVKSKYGEGTIPFGNALFINIVLAGCIILLFWKNIRNKISKM